LKRSLQQIPSSIFPIMASASFSSSIQRISALSDLPSQSFGSESESVSNLNLSSGSVTLVESNLDAASRPEKTYRGQSKGAAFDKNLSTSYIEQLGSEIVEIQVGPKKNVFYVHKNILCNSAQYFDAMFNGGFREAHTKTVEFPEDHIEAWELLVEWCYKGYIASRDPSDLVALYEHAVKLVKLHCLAEKYDMPVLVSEALENIVKAHAAGVRLMPEVCAFAYENSAPDSSLRTYMSKYFLNRLVVKKGKGVFDLKSLAAAAAKHPELIEDVFSHILALDIPKGESKLHGIRPMSVDPNDYLGTRCDD